MPLSRTNAPKLIREARSESDNRFAQTCPLPSHLGIAGNTFRAYRLTGTSPSKIYRNWVKEAGFSLVSNSIPIDRTSALQLHNDLADSFEQWWSRSAQRALRLCEKYKVVDLFSKALVFHDSHPCMGAREALYRLANIPLDQYSLEGVQYLFFGIVIADKPRMGMIKDQDTYDFIQSQIYELTSSVDVPNIVFDHFAWDRKRHSGRE